MSEANTAGWYETGRGVVVPWKCDHFGHMNVRFYAEAFDDASFHIWSVIGVPIVEMEEERGLIGVVASLKIDFLQEIRVGQLYVIESAIVRVGGKSFTYRERMRGYAQRRRPRHRRPRGGVLRQGRAQGRADPGRGAGSAGSQTDRGRRPMKHVRIERDGRIATVTLDRGNTANALSLPKRCAS